MLAVLDCRAPKEVQDQLCAMGDTPVLLPPHPALPLPVASHPDMLLFFGRDRIYTAKSYYAVAREELDRVSAALQKELVLTEEELRAGYPDEILFNAARVGEHLFCLAEHTAKEILEQERLQIVPVRQGYAKCSVLPVGDRALITADPSIASAAERLGLDVLRLTCQGACLAGYETGFFGGASSFSPYQSTNEICFCGDLSLHPEGNLIERFCKKHGKSPVSLSRMPLLDLGTVFLV